MNWILAGAIALAALGMGWLGKSWQDGQQAKVDLQEARDAQVALTDSLTKAAIEAEALRTKMGEISTSYEEQRNANSARATSSRQTVRTVVSNTPTLAAGRVPRDFVLLFNETRSPRDAVGATAGRSAGEPAATVRAPSGAPDR
jgi:hypothetical protein